LTESAFVAGDPAQLPRRKRVLVAAIAAFAIVFVVREFGGDPATASRSST
jgi:hypothetical protein